MRVRVDQSRHTVRPLPAMRVAVAVVGIDRDLPQQAPDLNMRDGLAHADGGDHVRVWHPRQHNRQINEIAVSDRATMRGLTQFMRRSVFARP